MINLAGIYTLRDTPQPYYWDIVYEWEDEFSKVLGIPLVPVGKLYDKIYKPGVARKLLNRLNYYQIRDKYLFTPEKHFLAFHIGPPGVYSFHSRKDVIPIIIDFWKNENLDRLRKIFSTTKIVFVTSKEVYNFLIEKETGITLELLSLSLPDKFCNLEETKKDIDLIQIGRQNQKINEFVQKFLEEYPETNYVYSVKSEGKVYNVSTKYGIINEGDDRNSFIDLLSRSKVSLLSAPGLDGDSVRTGGFSPVTPRFFESAACRCFMLGIYPENEDFMYYGIEKVCENIKDYNSFKEKVLSFLRSESFPDYSKFLKVNLSSVRANELKIKMSI